MMDQLYDRNYQDAREELHAGIDRGLARLGRAIGAAFRALNRIQFQAPWAPPAATPRSR